METDKLLTISAVTWGQAKHHLPLFLHSLMLQTRRDFQVEVWHDGNDKCGHEPTKQSYEETKRVVNRFKIDYGIPIVLKSQDDRFNDYGHSMRAVALKECETKYLNWQNADNYLTPAFVEAFLTKMETEGLGFCYCNLVHNYPNVNGDWKEGYNILDSAPHLNRIDIANFVVKTKLAQRIGFNHRSTGADGLFVNELMAWEAGKFKFAKIDRVLMVHN